LVNKKIVGIGGGTGSLTILDLPELGYDLTLVGSVADGGGSTGKLIKANPHILPPGDFRCIISNSAKNEHFRKGLEKRMGHHPVGSETLLDLIGFYGEELKEPVISGFEQYGCDNALYIPCSEIGIDNLNGHPLGNLLLTSLMIKCGNAEGIRKMCELAETFVEVLPASENRSTFCFMTASMTRPCKGEQELDDFERTAEPITNCWLEPEIKPYGLAIDKIKESDYVILTPTSLYANLVSFLLIPGFKEVLKGKRIIWIGNIMTEWNQTAYSSHSLSGIGHLEILREYSGRYPGHVIVPKLGGQTLGQVFGAYREEGASAVLYRPRDFEERGIGYTGVNMIKTENIIDKGKGKAVLRHDRGILAKKLDEVIKGYG